MLVQALWLATVAVVAVTAEPATIMPSQAPPPGPPPRASVKTYRVDWYETVESPSGRRILEIRVSSVTLTRAGIEGPDYGSWHANVSLKNVAPGPIAVGRKAFGVLVYFSKREGEPYAGLPASRFRPALPRSLRPGERWGGRIDGPRPIPGAPSYVRLSFGLFTTSAFRGGEPFAWVTDHGIEIRA